MRIVVHPILEPERELDVTRRLIAAIAEELWLACGGNSELNWLEAELHLQQIAGRSARSAKAPAAAAAWPGPLAAGTGATPGPDAGVRPAPGRPRSAPRRGLGRAVGRHPRRHA
jgi:hypothetical protein